MELNKDERIDDLEYRGMKIIQNKNYFCFGIDSILLSDFAKEIKDNSICADFGTGTGILGILLCAKTKLKKIYGIELQNNIAEIAKRNIQLNNLEDRFEIINENIKNINKVFPKKTFDYIITNPPYKKINTGKQNENQEKVIARHEVEANLEDFVQASYDMLKDTGSLYMVHRTDRLVDILYILRQKRLEPKIIKFVYSNINEASKLVLIKAVKNGKTFLKMEKPIYIYDENGNYTNEILEIYNKK